MSNRVLRSLAELELMGLAARPRLDGPPERRAPADEAAPHPKGPEWPLDPALEWIAFQER
jgi:hypothetical protein